jgi:hypothetical protein
VPWSSTFFRMESGKSAHSFNATLVLMRFLENGIWVFQSYDYSTYKETANWNITILLMNLWSRILLYHR